MTILNEYYKYENISKEREQELFENIDSEENREEIIKSHLKLVANIAKRYSFLSPPLLEDLLQEGTLGLIESIYKFDPSLGFRFSTFASFRIRNSIKKSLRKAAFSFYVPNKKVHMAFRLARKMRQNKELSNQDMSLNDICESMNCEPRQARDLLFLLSCNEEPFDDNKISKNINTEKLDMKLKLMEIREILSYFNKKDRKIMDLRYNHGKSWRQISEKTDMSHEGCRKRHGKIILLIKSQLFNKEAKTVIMQKQRKIKM